MGFNLKPAINLVQMASLGCPQSWRAADGTVCYYVIGEEGNNEHPGTGPQSNYHIYL